MDVGLVKDIGCSNFNSQQLQRLLDEARIKPAADQVWYRYHNDNSHTERCNSEFVQSPHCAMHCLQHVCLSEPDAVMCKSHTIH